MLNIKVGANQLNLVAKDIEKYREIVRDTDGFYKRVSDVLRAAIMRQFSSKGAYFHTPWPKLATSTLEQKKYSSYSLDILKRTEKYYKALTDKTSPDRIQKITEHGLEFGLDLDSFRDEYGLIYPVLHETGTDEIPARPVFAKIRKSRKFRAMLGKRLLVYLAAELKRVS